MFVELMKPLVNQQPGDVIDLEPNIADTLAAKGYVRRLRPTGKVLV